MSPVFLERWELLLPTSGVPVGSAGEMAIDNAVYDELQSSGMFEAMDLDMDEVNPCMQPKRSGTHARRRRHVLMECWRMHRRSIA